MVQQVFEMLSWQDGGNVARSIRTRYREQLQAAVEFWLVVTAYTRVPGKARLAEQFARLPKASRIRLISAPETYHRLVYRLTDSSPETVAFFANALRAERCRLGHARYPRVPVWTARGDACFSARPIAMPRYSTKAGTQRVWRAPILGRGPAIDGCSPFGTAEAADGAPTGTAHTPAELVLITRRLRAAVRRIARVRADALLALRVFTQVVVCRKAEGPPANFSSTSWPAFIGKTAVFNAHVPGLTLERIANALIHEAIHAGLFMAEVCQASVIDSPRFTTATVVSPWSGRTLPMHNYVHACFVWYGLWQFWRQAAGSQAFTDLDASRLMSRAGAGFRGGSLVLPLQALRKFVAPSLLDSIRQSQETVLDHYKLHMR